MDIARQVYWVLTNDLLQTANYDPSLLKSYYQDLHREARRKKTLFYFVVDGLEELEETVRQSLLQYFVDILPSGVTSKAASWGHFKTGQLQTIIQDNNFFYLAGCCSGKSSLTQPRYSRSDLRCSVG